MTGTHVFTPWDDPSWTIAAHPCTYQVCVREPDWWFDLHPKSCYTKPKTWRPDYYHWLTHLQTPIFMQKDWPDVPMAVRFPKERLMGEYRAYFTNHCAWMIALAMTEGVTHIGVFGCEYSHESERGRQRGSLEFWLGMFEGRGGHVILPPGSRVLNTPAELYGYESHDAKTGKLIPSYSVPPTIKMKTSTGQIIKSPMHVIDQKTAEGRIPLAKCPDPTVSPAWERSGLKIHA